MKLLQDKKGALILEALIATAVSSVFIVSIAGIAINSSKNIQELKRNQQAIWSANEGTEAIRSMDFWELSPIENATLVYDQEMEIWQVQSGGPEVLDGGLERELSLLPVRRDINCNIVASGGWIDPDSLLVRSTVSWTTGNGQNRSVNSERLVTNWQTPTGDCFFSDSGDGVRITVKEAYWGGSRQLRDVIVTNNTPLELTVTHMMLTWDRPNANIQQVFAFDTKVWANNGPGSPSGNQSSGTILDIEDSVIPPGTSSDAYKIQFTGNMHGSVLTITFYFDDGSTFTSPRFQPI